MKRLKRKQLGFWLLTFCFILLGTGCSKRAENIKGSIKIATGPSNLVYHRLGKKIKSLLHNPLPLVKISLKKTKGTMENVRLLFNKKVD